MWEPFNDSSRLSINRASEIAKKLGQTQIEPEHMLLGIIGEKDGIVASLLESQGIDIQAMEKELTAPLGKTPPAEQKEMDFAPRSRKVIEQAFEEARKFNHRYLGSEHLFLSILSLKEGASHEGLLRCGINAEDVAAKFHEYFGA